MSDERKDFNFKINVYPEEIAQTLCDIADKCNREYGAEPTSGKTAEDVEDTIEYLMGLAQNEYNSDHFRTTYRLLELIADCRSLFIINDEEETK